MVGSHGPLPPTRESATRTAIFCSSAVERVWSRIRMKTSLSGVESHLILVEAVAKMADAPLNAPARADTSSNTSKKTEPRTTLPSLLHGPSRPALRKEVLGELIEEQSRRNGSRTAVSFPWQQHSLSYQQLANRSRLLAKSMLEAGLKHGDCIGIMAGNCYQYIEVFLGAARIGCPLVVFNNTYSPKELCSALSVSCEYTVSSKPR